MIGVILGYIVGVVGLSLLLALSKIAKGLFEYTNEYFGARTMESSGFSFAARRLSLKIGEIAGDPYRSAAAELHLAPFPANANQILELMVRLRKDVAMTCVHGHRLIRNSWTACGSNSYRGVYHLRLKERSITNEVLELHKATIIQC